MKIIFPDRDSEGNDTGIICVIHPTGEIPVEDVARKDVPQGVPYRFVPNEAIPEDRTFRQAWEADFSEPDGFGDPAGWWADQAALAAQQEEQPE